MMKKLSFLALAVAGLIGFSACGSDDAASPSPTPTPGPITPVSGTILKLASGTGSWDEGFVTPKGYFLLKKNATSSSKARKAAGAADLSTETLYFTSLDGATKATLLVSKADNRPLQLVMNDGVLNFSWLSDEDLELVFKTATAVMPVAQIKYSKATLDEALSKADYKNNLQRTLFYFVSTVDASVVSGYPTVAAALEHFRDVAGMTYQAKTVTPTEAKVETTSDGTCTFVPAADTFEETVVEKAYSTVTVWTGTASFKVGGSSCTLSGTVFCADPSFKEKGTVGVVCDKNPDNLFIGKAEFEGTAELKDDNNFDVDFRGLNPKSKYYYRAFYQFNAGAAAPELVLDPAQKYDETTSYDTTTKSFTTDENKLIVDVIMVMDISGSMSDEINMVKSNAKAFYQLFNDKCIAAGITLNGLNAQVITYSDINVDNEEALNESPVYNMANGTEHDAFEAYVDEIELSYGGDTPESGLEALAAAFKRESWGVDDGYHRQVVILWTDATYKIVNEGICRKYQMNEDGTYAVDADGNSIDLGPMYQAYTYDEVKAMWDEMPTGRRMILFAPYDTNGYTNEGDWGLMDGWKNVFHEETSVGSDNLGDFDKSLDYIIEELTGKEKTTDAGSEAKRRKGSIRNRPEPKN